jgi:hypothetical protein
MGVLRMHSSSKISPEVLADGLFRLQFPAMGTHCKILYAANSMVAADIFRKHALDWVHRFEARYSRFRDDSLICRINDAAGRNPVVIDEIDIHLFEFLIRPPCHFPAFGILKPRIRRSPPNQQSARHFQKSDGRKFIERTTPSSCPKQGWD